MRLLTERKEIRITKIQAQSLAKLAKHNINVNQFIRDSIREKINRDWPKIKEGENNKIKCPF